MKKVYPVIIFSLLVLWMGCKKDEENSDPVAKFSWELTQTPGEVNFTNQSSNAQTYEWDFGDGKFNTQKDPVHVYDQNGTYYVNLKAFGNQKTSVARDTLLIDNIQ
jgi:PKD repeat protein